MKKNTLIIILVSLLLLAIIIFTFTHPRPYIFGSHVAYTIPAADTARAEYLANSILSGDYAKKK